MNFDTIVSLLGKASTAMHGVLAGVLGDKAAAAAPAALEIVGAIAVSLWALRLLAGFVGKLIGVVTRRKILWKAGEWAVVTGATDGLGKAYAREFARRGLNVVLISRTKSRLETVATEIREAFGVTVEIAAADMSRPVSDGIYDVLATALSGKAVSVLINNVGESYPGALELGELSAQDPDALRRLIDINLTSAVQMTNLVLPGMLSRKRGAIVNVSSAAGVLPVPYKYYALYAGVKGGLDAFSRTLNAETEPRGVSVQSIVPYLVASKLSKARPSLLVPTPDAYVRAAVPAIGSGDRVVPYWAHALLDAAFRGLPSWVVRAYLNATNGDLRRRYLAKRAKEAKSA